MEYKGFILKQAKNSPSLVAVVTAGRGGKIPNELGGLYTSKAVAKDAVDNYLVKKDGKSVKAKAKPTTKSAK